MTNLTDPQLAVTATRIAIVLFVISLGALALFFGGAGAFWGPINDVAIAFALLLLIPAVLVVGVAGGTPVWFQVLSWLAILGILVAAGGQLLLVVGVIPLGVTFVTGGLGFTPLLVWIAALGALALLGSTATPAVGWWAVAFVALAVIGLAAAQFLPLDAAGLTVVLGGPITIGFVGWAWTLASWLGSLGAA